MAKGKKTVEVKGMLDWANIQLSRTDEYADSKFKAGICSMIEKILTDGGNYKGFQFLNPNESNVGDSNYYSRYYSGNYGL